MGKMCKRLLTAVIGAVMSVSIFLPVLADESDKSISDTGKKAVMIGASHLGTNMNTKDAAKVWFGSNTTAPWPWQVIGNNNYGVGSKSNGGSLTLFSSINRGATAFYAQGTKNAYAGSDLQKAIVDLGENSFTQAEMNAIKLRELPFGSFTSSEPYTDGVAGKVCYNVRLWPLSSNEAYLLDESILTRQMKYWLRSPGYNDASCACTNQWGNLDYLGVDSSTIMSMRPAMNIQYSSVFLSSAAIDGKPTTSGTFGTMKEIGTCSDNQWKLTVLDTSRFGFSAYRVDTGKVLAGDQIEVSFSGATIASNTTEECVSGILLDSTGEPLYYTTLAMRTKNGTAQVTIPDSLKTGTYTLKVFSEQRNRNYYTDYTSNVEDIVLDVVAAPETPTIVSVSPTSNNYVRVYWNGVLNASGYEVYRATSASGPFTLLGSVTEISRSCGNLTSGKKYYFKVRAYTEFEGKKLYSGFSKVMSGVTPFKAPANVKAVATSNTYARVSWDAVSGASGYEVYRSSYESGTYTLLGSVTETSRSCGNLTSGKMWYFKVRAYVVIDGTKYFGDFSSPISIVTPLKAPSGVRAQATSNTYARVYWEEVPGATWYEVYRSTSLNGTYTLLGEVNDLSRSCGNLTSGKKYYFKVRAYSAVRGMRYYGDFSSPVSVVTPLAAPSGSVAG